MVETKSLPYWPSCAAAGGTDSRPERSKSKGDSAIPVLPSPNPSTLEPGPSCHCFTLDHLPQPATIPYSPWQPSNPEQPSIVLICTMEIMLSAAILCWLCLPVHYQLGFGWFPEYSQDTLGGGVYSVGGII